MTIPEQIANTSIFYFEGHFSHFSGQSLATLLAFISMNLVFILAARANSLVDSFPYKNMSCL